MRPGPRSVTVATVLLLAAALAGCGAQSAVPEVANVTPPATHPPIAVAPPPAAEPPPLSPPLEVPMPPVPTVHGPYMPPTPGPDASAPPEPAPGPSPTPTGSPATSPTPGRSLLELLPAAATLPQLSWTDAAGEHTATWTARAPAAALAPAAAIAHLRAAREAGGACAVGADAVVTHAIDAAAGSFAAESAPGTPVELVLVRYPTRADAEAALASLQLLGDACAGIATDEGELGAGEGAHGPTAVLRAGDAVLIAESTAIDALLAVVLHEGAPPEAVAMLLASPR